MEKKTLSLAYTFYSNVNELPDIDQELLNSSKEIADHAYAPYSEFFVGAALRLNNGNIIQGNNQENAAYPSGICAERVAIFYASSQFPNEKIDCIAIYAKNSDRAGDIISPCGACRQVISEYEHKQLKDIRVLLMNQKEEVWEFENIATLLPFSFKLQPIKNIQ